MKYFCLIVILIIQLGGLNTAQAIFFESNLFYVSDNFVYSENSQGTIVLGDICIGLSSSRKGDYFLGLSGGSISATDSTLIYSSADLGLKFGAFLDREHTWGLGLVYNIQTRVTFTDADSNQEQWRGTGYKVELGYAPAISDSFSIGVRLNYYVSQLIECVIDSSVLTQVSYSRAFIYPSLYLALQF